MTSENRLNYYVFILGYIVYNVYEFMYNINREKIMYVWCDWNEKFVFFEREKGENLLFLLLKCDDDNDDHHWIFFNANKNIYG